MTLEKCQLKMIQPNFLTLSQNCYTKVAQTSFCKLNSAIFPYTCYAFTFPGKLSKVDTKKSVKFFSQVLHLGKKDPSPYTGSGVTGDEKILQLCDTET